MNFTIVFDNASVFSAAVNVLALSDTPSYEVNNDDMTIITDDVRSIAGILGDEGITNFKCFNEEGEVEHDQFLTDAEADADALASAGWGTDEDYMHNYCDDNTCLGDEY